MTPAFSRLIARIGAESRPSLAAAVQKAWAA
jgi:hypothetical protein